MDKMGKIIQGKGSIRNSINLFSQRQNASKSTSNKKTFNNSNHRLDLPHQATNLSIQKV